MNSVGFMYIFALVGERSRAGFREVNPDWLTDEERELYEFCLDHIARYGQCPTEEAVADAGYRRTREARESSSYYANRIRQRAIHQGIGEYLEGFQTAMQNRDPDVAVSVLQNMLAVASTAREGVRSSTLADEADLFMERFLERQRSGSDLLGVTSGFPTVDALTHGFTPGDVVAIVGRPSVGKSYKLFKSAHAAWRSGASLLIGTMEMSVEQCANRIIGLESQINPAHLRTGRVGTNARGHLQASLDRIPGMPPIHFLAGDVRKTMADFDALAEETNPDIIYIDAGYLMAPERKRQRSGRREYIADVMEEMKGLAVGRNRPIVTTVQFNREVKKGSNKELDLSMIAETDVIAQIMSIVIGVRHASGAIPLERRCDIMKNREGETGSYVMNFRHSPMLFDEKPGTGRVASVEEDDDDVIPTQYVSDVRPEAITERG